LESIPRPARDGAEPALCRDPDRRPTADRSSGQNRPREIPGALQIDPPRDKDIARAFNDFRRSTALAQLGIIHSQGLFTAEELLRFSPMTRENLALYAPIPEAEGLSPQPKRMED